MLLALVLQLIHLPLLPLPAHAGTGATAATAADVGRSRPAPHHDLYQDVSFPILRKQIKALVLHRWSVASSSDPLSQEGMKRD